MCFHSNNWLFKILNFFNRNFIDLRFRNNNTLLISFQNSNIITVDYVKKQLDTTIATTYYEVVRMIVEREQQGEKREKYGIKLLQGLAEYLSKRHGKGFSLANLRNMRQFYQICMPQIQ